MMAVEKIKTRMDILETLLDAYPRSNMTAKNIKVYAMALTCLSEEELGASILRCIRVCKFFPAISEIIEQAETMKKAAIGEEEITAGEAWAIAMQECQNRAHFQEPKIKDKCVAEAVRRFGWVDLHQLQEKDVGIAKAQFRRIYEDIVNRNREKRINNNVLEIMGNTVIEKLKEKEVKALNKYEH